MRLILINNQNQSINLLAVGEGAMLESCYSDAGKQPTSRISLLYYCLKAHGKKKKKKVFVVFWDRCRRPLTHQWLHSFVNRSKGEVRIDESKKSKKTCIAKLEDETVKGALSGKSLKTEEKTTHTQKKHNNNQEKKKENKKNTNTLFLNYLCWYYIYLSRHSSMSGLNGFPQCSD